MPRRDTGCESLLVVAALLVLACGPACRGSTASESEHSRLTRPGAPAPYGCQTDDTCVPGPAINPDNLCCDSGVPLRVFNRDYLRWHADWKRQHCENAKCPVMPSPAQPLPCSLEGRCVAGQCQHRCNAQDAVDINQTVLPTEVAAEHGLNKGSETWQPTPQDLALTNSLLAVCLPTLPAKPNYQADKTSQIVSALVEYRRQWVPHRDGQSHRILWLNAFRDRSNRHPDWRTKLVSVKGGGHDYFSVLIDLDTQRCTDLRINSPR